MGPGGSGWVCCSGWNCSGLVGPGPDLKLWYTSMLSAASFSRSESPGHKALLAGALGTASADCMHRVKELFGKGQASFGLGVCCVALGMLAMHHSELRPCMQELQSISQQLAESRRAAEEAHTRSSQVSTLTSSKFPRTDPASGQHRKLPNRCRIELSMLLQLAMLLRMVAMHASGYE